MNKILILLALLSISCEEEMHPKCAELEQHCKTLLRQMDQAKTEKERWQIEQFYLAEKHGLDFCLKSN